MSGVTQVEIKESAPTLKELLKQQNTPFNYSKAQALYFLKSQKCETVQSAANLVGRHRITVHRWLKQYKEGGLSALLEINKSPGCPKKIPVEVVAKLQQELRDPEGFLSDEESRIWLLALQDIPVSYMTAYRLTREKLKSKPKVPRPRHIRQKPGASEEFRKNLPQKLKTEKEKIKRRWEYKRKLRFWNGDETRIGMKTKMGKVITLKGVKPIGNHQWEFKNYYVYGAIEPETGELFWCECSHLNRDCFEIFLQQMSAYYPEDIHIIQVDNAPFHTSNDLEVPAHIILLFHPPLLSRGEYERTVVGITETIFAMDGVWESR